MVLSQFKILKDNNTYIILGAMIIGILYPFFINTEIPVINDSKYLSIGALLIGAILFWELYPTKSTIGSSQSFEGLKTPFESRTSPIPAQRKSQQLSQPSYPQKKYASQQPVPPPQTPSQSPIPSEQDVSSFDQNLSKLQQQYAGGDMPTEPIHQPAQQPRLLNVVKGKEQLPKQIPIPKDIPTKQQSKKTEQSSFEKFDIQQ